MTPGLKPLTFTPCAALKIVLVNRPNITFRFVTRVRFTRLAQKVTNQYFNPEEKQGLPCQMAEPFASRISY